MIRPSEVCTLNTENNLSASQDNELSTFGAGGDLQQLLELQVLDLRNNSIDKLSEDLGRLTNLRVSPIEKQFPK